MQMKTPTAFFAYPSDPASIGEVIKTAISDINATGVVVAKSW